MIQPAQSKELPMPSAYELLHNQSIIVASYLTWVDIPDVQNAPNREARDTEIENFKRTILFRLSAEIQIFAGSALSVYTFFDSQNEEERFSSWQDKVEAASEEAKACDFDALSTDEILTDADNKMADTLASRNANINDPLVEEQHEHSIKRGAQKLNK